jgi:hypothetical protein
VHQLGLARSGGRRPEHRGELPWYDSDEISLIFSPSQSDAMLQVVNSIARGTFDVDLAPGRAELDGAVTRFELTKRFHGDFDGSGEGVMLSGGDPEAGTAGYVAIETVRGHLGDREGSFALQQFGTMRAGSQTLHYEVVPGSGDGELTGISGKLHLTIDDKGTHFYELEYEL